MDDLSSGSESQLEDRVEEFGSGRGLTAMTVGMFIPVVVIWLISLVFALLPIGALLGVLIGNTDAGIAIACIGWTFGAGLAFFRPVEERLGKLLFGLRQPTPLEMKALRPLWDAICEEAAIDPRRYILKIENSSYPNALAAAGRLVAVTDGAMELPADMLQGILAHELGHHRDLHPIASLLTWWYLLPIGLLDWCLRIVVRISAFILGFFRGWLIFVLSIVLLALLLVRFLFFIPVKATRVLGLMMGRAGEYRADRHATDSGYGPGLVRALQFFLNRGFDDDLPRGFARLYNSHPPLQKRILAIERRMEDTRQPPQWRL
jgi:STE24 endopeptidase